MLILSVYVYLVVAKNNELSVSALSVEDSYITQIVYMANTLTTLYC